MIKVEKVDVLKNYRSYIETNIERWLGSRPDIEKEGVFEKVLSKLDGRELRAERGEGSVKSYIRLVIWGTSVDHWRKLNSRKARERRLEIKKDVDVKMLGEIDTSAEAYGSENSTADEVDALKSTGISSRVLAYLVDLPGKDRKALSKKRRARIDSVELLQALKSFDIKGVGYTEIFEAYCLGIRRKQMAGLFGLRENQVRGRLAYTKKKIREGIKRHKSRENLKNLKKI